MVDEIEIEHVRRRINRAESAIDRERVSGSREIDPLRKHNLEDVARADVLLCGFDVIPVSLWRGVRARAISRGSRERFVAERKRRQGRTEPGDKPVNPV